MACEDFFYISKDKVRLIFENNTKDGTASVLGNWYVKTSNRK